MRQITGSESHAIFRGYLDRVEGGAAFSVRKMWAGIEGELHGDWDEIAWGRIIETGHTEWATEKLTTILAEAIIRGHQYILKQIYTKALLDAWAMEGGKEQLREWVLGRSLTTVENLTRLQLKTLRREFYYWVVFRRKPVNVVASQLAKVVGLLPAQQEALIKLREGLRAEGATPRQVKNAAERFRRFAKKQRALAIARTEIATAYQRGKLITIRQGISEGTLIDVTKTWNTSEDERVCSICGPLNNETVGINKKFSGGRDAPPAHPRCRCDIAYSEEGG